MRRSLAYEAAATVAAMVGAITLAVVFFPFLNPGFTSLRGFDASLGECLVMAIVPVGILFGAWRLNEKAVRLKSEGK
jgi:hypothetical protein